MDFNDLYFFYLIAEHGGFTAAERVSGVTKSLLSRRIAKLEERTNVRLIQRNSRSFSLTSAGKVLFEHAAQMVKDGQLAYESVSELIAEPSGTIKVSCPTVLAQYNLAPILPGFMARYPKVNVIIDATDRHVQIIEEMFDFALRAKASLDDEPGLIARTLATSRLILVASPGFLNHYTLPESPDDLGMMPTISSVLDRYEGEQKWKLVNTEGTAVIIKHRPVLYCLNPRVQLEAVLHGIGVGLIPESIAFPSVREGNLVQILKEWTIFDHIIHAVYPSRKHMNPAVRAFLEYLLTHLPTNMKNSHYGSS
ncbi:LysR family transcriptional regulator [Pectobacterium polaris]|uniref:LysR family transcriptional regulator n=1 Tax=Pectobacterium polaris TaxID=2042057 RepID=UPI0019699E92|nr:LysR family transcriptional regulator [Pectobacterium polaris]MBN3215265.1 LysR family transcriptional regulator [Pectobacterium polaris]MCA6952196.1 LysR family transcriptional regulator [Pectobacterium polaris]